MSKRIVSEERIAESRRSERITKMSEEFGTEMEGERERGIRSLCAGRRGLGVKGQPVNCYCGAAVGLAQHKSRVRHA